MSNSITWEIGCVDCGGSTGTTVIVEAHSDRLTADERRAAHRLKYGHQNVVLLKVVPQVDYASYPDPPYLVG